MRQVCTLAFLLALPVFTATCLAAAPDAAPATGPATSPAITPVPRAEAIKQTLATIDVELKSHGGSWDVWATQLKPFRDDLERIRTTTKWPWPAKKNFQFQGKEIDLLLQDDLSARPEGQNPLPVILRLNEQLKARGIDLILMPIPDKLSIYPDYLSDKAPEDRNVALPTRRLMKQLLEKDVEVIDLQALYHKHRQKTQDAQPVFLTGDAHWRNLGAQLAASEIAARLARYDFVAKAMPENPYTTEPRRRTDGVKADDILVVLDKRTGECYSDTLNSPILFTGDSFANQNQDPRAMASITAQVAKHIGMPLTVLSREGLSGDMPVELARLERDSGCLKNCRVVIWTFCTRMFVTAKWPAVDLPAAGAAPAGPPALAAVTATGTIAATSQRPNRSADYPDFVMKLHLTGLTDAAGKPLGDVVVHILAMKDRKILPAASLAKGAKVQFKLVPWDNVRKQYGSTMSGPLPDAKLETEKPHYWGEIVRP